MKMRVATLTFAAVALSGCHKAPPPEAALPQANIETMTVQSSTASSTLSLPAHIAADPTHLVHVYAPLSGQVLSLSVVAGQEVKKGQTIAMLRSGDVAAARSDFEKAKIEADRADRALARGKILLDHEVLSQAAYIELQATANGDHAELERTRQRLRELGFSESGTSDVTAIPAPISGTVIDVGTAAGEYQRSLETANGIATIADLSTVWVEGEIFERDLTVLKRAEQVAVTVQAYPGETFHGSVSNLGDVFDPTTHTLRVRIVLANPGHRLKPAMFANVLVERPAATTIHVPATAVIHNGDSTFVYVQGGDGKFTLRQVVTGDTADNVVEIKSGLQNGERIVKAGAAFLRTPVGG